MCTAVVLFHRYFVARSLLTNDRFVRRVGWESYLCLVSEELLVCVSALSSGSRLC